MKRFEGKTAVVTGGSSGIGRATALAFAREGANVVIADIAVEGGEETVRMIEETGSQALFVKTDVSKSSEVEVLVKKAVQTYGRLDCAFNNAGVAWYGILARFAEEAWDRILATNLKGVFLCMKYEIPQMLKQGGGTIVNTASVGGLVGVSHSPAYIASKHGVVGLTKEAALDYVKSGIRINCVCPGTIRTPLVERAAADVPELDKRLIEQTPMGRMGQPEEIAWAVLWLCSDEASFVTGSSMVVDGGYSMQ